MSVGRQAPSRAIYGCGGDPIDDDIADNWCTNYHCAGDCGLRGHGYQHDWYGDDADPEQQEWVISGTNLLMQDMIDTAQKAVAENARHSHDSLYNLIGEWFPEATDEEVEQAVKEAL